MAEVEFPGHVVRFDPVRKMIVVPAPATDVLMQDVYNNAQDFMQHPGYTQVGAVLEATGKTELGSPTKLTEILMILLDGWLIEFEARGGPATVLCTVSGGSLVGKDSGGLFQHPINPTAFTHTTIVQATAGTIVGVTSTEIRNALTYAATRAPDAGSVDEFLVNLWASAGGRAVIDETAVPFPTLTIYDDSDNVVRVLDLKDRDGNAATFGASVQTGEIFDRDPQ